MPPKRKADAVDAGAEPPKRPQAGYGQFVSEKRAEITATLEKEKVDKSKMMTLVSKRAGEMWKALGEAKQAPYNQKSAKLVEAWNKAMETFKQSNPDFKKVKKLKKGDTPKPPSRPGSAFVMWMKDNSQMLTERVMKKHNVDKGKAFFMLYGEGKPVYEALSAAEKKKWEAKAEAAKAQFQADMTEWKENNKDAIADGKAAKKGTDTGPKRPRLAFAQWMYDNRKMLTDKIVKEHKVEPKDAFFMMAKESKPVWAALPAAVRKKYEDKAEEEKAKFQAEKKEWKLKNKNAKADEGEEEDDEEDEDGESP